MSDHQTAASITDRLTRDFTLPEQTDPETCFHDMEWRATFLHKAAGSTALYSTKNSRHWAAVTMRSTSYNPRYPLNYMAYSANGTHGPALTYSDYDPDVNAAWARHNLIAFGTDMTDQSRLSLAHISGALAIMHKRGDVGRESRSLSGVKPVTELYNPEEERKIVVYTRQGDADGPFIAVDTVHLRHDTTSIGICTAPSVEKACYGDDNETSLRVNISMFGRPTPSTHAYINQLFAAAVSLSIA